MIKLKSLLKENSGNLSSKTIFDFYYLWYLYTNNPILFESNYGKFILENYTEEFKKICVDLFKKLVYKQIVKYVQRNRIDIDFPKGQPTGNTSSKDLLLLMKKTFRSDMKRRNTRWEGVAESVANLENSNSPKDIFLWVNQLFNAVHNTETKVMDKFPNYYSELLKAFDIVRDHNPQHWKQFVSSDIRQIENQDTITERKKKK